MKHLGSALVSYSIDYNEYVVPRVRWTVKFEDEGYIKKSDTPQRSPWDAVSPFIYTW